MSPIINFNSYQNIILDFDGVILDSNKIKENAIREVAIYFLNDIESEEFVNFFVRNNGIPREIKIKKYINDEDTYHDCLELYNKILNTKLKNAKFTTNAKRFIRMLVLNNLPVYILSGGDEKEVVNLLKFHNLFGLFTKVMGGPKTKYDNMNHLKVNGKTLYFGDSLVDYEVAKKYSLDFVFMYQYSQLQEWREYFKDKREVKVIKNFELFSSDNF
jgi:phosphoglycolate phosphatase-like HAD superfamily hydrolase